MGLILAWFGLSLRPTDRSPFCPIEEEWERELETELKEYEIVAERNDEPITDDDLEDLKWTPRPNSTTLNVQYRNLFRIMRSDL